MLRLIVAAFLLPCPALASPFIIAPAEPMATLQGLESIGPSRLSTINHCLAVANAETELLTDQQWQDVEDCLIEHS